ncbi:hypothetical protein JK628_23145 (plasmid) [Shewanella sp. KX20019]|uniref:hypothetical protein n=1 Tax=Shewanella sp. KX20019 TaxID=2803864 RepID=UPI001925211E|nr:hypothetical protein [Shewanella sp. KX20019]QQX82680.1 hypothetical protein JK628_23145 [Shewanella sp. KX20019]
MSLRKTELFIEKCIEAQGDHFDYSLVDYVDRKTSVKIICPIHGEKIFNPELFLKNGCYCCNQSNTRNKGEYWPKQNKKFIKIIDSVFCKDA